MAVVLFTPTAKKHYEFDTHTNHAIFKVRRIQQAMIAICVFHLLPFLILRSKTLESCNVEVVMWPCLLDCNCLKIYDTSIYPFHTPATSPPLFALIKNHQNNIKITLWKEKIVGSYFSLWPRAASIKLKHRRAAWICFTSLMVLGSLLEIKKMDEGMWKNGRYWWN